MSRVTQPCHNLLHAWGSPFTIRQTYSWVTLSTFQLFNILYRDRVVTFPTFNNPCSPFPSTPSLIRLDKSVFVTPFLHNPHLELIVTEFVNQPEITEKTLQSQHIGIYIRHTVETFLKNASFDVRSYICLSFNKMHSEDSF